MARHHSSATTESIVKTVDSLMGKTKRSHDPEISIKIVRRKNGDILEIAGRPMNGAHLATASDPTVLASAGVFLQRLLLEFFAQTSEDSS